MPAVMGTGAGWDLRAVIPQAAVLIEPGCPGQQRGKPGSTLRPCWPCVSCASQRSGPLCRVSCESPPGEKSSPRETEPQQVVAGVGAPKLCGGTGETGEPGESPTGGMAAKQNPDWLRRAWLC